MQYSWDEVVRPTLEAQAPKTILEIGVGDGGNTEHLARFATANGARVHSVDPYPRVDPTSVVRRHPVVSFLVARSTVALDLVGPVDVALIDGDHTWWTVTQELAALDRIHRQRGRPHPVVVFHDVGWPYGRRDAYLDPAVPVEGRQPSRVGGVLPGQDLPRPHEGLNPGDRHADHEGGPANGVLTAVEDHLDRIGAPMHLRIDPWNWGVGVLVPQAWLARRPQLQAVLDRMGDRAWQRARAAAEQQRVAQLLGLPVASDP